MQRLYTALVIAVIVVGGYFVYKNWREPSVGSVPEEINLQANTTSTETQSEETTPVITSNKIMYATIATNLGNIELELDQKSVPNTVNNFITLAQKGFYDGTRFHRVINNFMIQGGDPLSKDVSKKSMWGTGGPGYQFADEIGSNNHNLTGTISMANAGPNTNGSQFFINTVDNVGLDPKHTVFGKVISGMDIVQKISKVPTDSADRPINDIIVSKITVSETK